MIPHGHATENVARRADAARQPKGPASVFRGAQRAPLRQGNDGRNGAGRTKAQSRHGHKGGAKRKQAIGGQRHQAQPAQRGAAILEAISPAAEQRPNHQTQQLRPGQHHADLHAAKAALCLQPAGQKRNARSQSKKHARHQYRRAEGSRLLDPISCSRTHQSPPC